MSSRLMLLAGVAFLVTGIASAQTEENKALVRHAIEELWNQQKLEVVDEVYAPNYIYHDPSGDYDRDGRKQFIAMYLAAFPDVHFTIDDQIAEGDKVVARWTATATHKGELMGIPPTGAYGPVTGISIYQVADGVIVEEWSEWDIMGMLEHMGVVPASRQDYTWGEPSTVTGEPGDPEVNKSIVSRYAEEVWNQHNLDMLDELMSTDVISHVPIPGTVLTGLEAHKQTIGVYITAFPDLHNTVEDLIAEGDKVAERWTATATHRGELMGIPPTGKQVAWTGITIYRFADGKIVENWWAWNKLGLMQQLGVIPPLGPQAVESRTWGKVKVGFRR